MRPSSSSDFTFIDLAREVEEQRRLNPSWRVGQAYFNVLHRHRPEVANAIRGTRIDPFHLHDDLTDEVSEGRWADFIAYCENALNGDGDE